MRDPDLVTRAQRAAVALERAWERWRAMHGLSADPMPPVSSYVGYSIEEPWGRPRVVFGVDAREAELLAALLDHHECVGPFYQADQSGAGHPGAALRDSSPLDEARSRIPAQAHAAEERPPQRWAQDGEPGVADGRQDGLAGADPGDEPHYPDRRSAQENGAAELPRQDETQGGNGQPADHRRGRRTEPGRPSRRERRAAGRQRPAGPREPVTEAGTDATEHAVDGNEADEASWPPEVPGLSWPDHKAEPAGGAPAGRASGGPAVASTPVDSTTVDSIPVQGAAADRAPAAPDGAAPDERAPRGKSLYDVTKASRERRQDTGRGRGTGQADRRQRAARDLGQVRAADAGRGGKPSAEPVSSNGATDAGYAGAGRGLAAAEPSSQDPAGPGLPGQARAGATAASQAQHGRGEDAAQDAGYPVPDGQERVDEAGAQHAGTAQWAQDTDPGLDFAADQGLDYADDAGLDYTADAGLDYAGDAGLDYAADAGLDYAGDAGLDYAGDTGQDYAGDTGQDYPGDDSWDDLAGAGESWGTGRAGPADPNADPGRSGVAGLDQLWDLGRGPAGQGHIPDAPARRPQDAVGQDPRAGTVPGTARDGAPGTGEGDAGLGGAHSNGAAGHASAAHGAGLIPARETGPAPDGGPARDARPRREAGPGGEGGSAWDIRTAREAGSARDAGPVPARDAGQDLPDDFGPDPLGPRASKESADFLAAPPPTSSILTAPRPESRTARPGNVGTETIAAELAGWAAGELPGQASARLAAWAAIGGVPAAGYRTEGSDLGPAGVTTERVR